MFKHGIRGTVKKHHNIDWDESMILKYEENYQKRTFYVACFIKTTKDALNRNLGVNIPKIYDAILTEKWYYVFK